ncbi:hypothetical protein CGRA01v4_01974 [Colletotrichum graminicola]|uniref:Uncharacterized protein n=1 Tax=Colletotrichum graminicola (strain M1.001 / M2 / FGSC 10212) TaxID=645133 RepID=E3QJP2_COLGM|nr:uncharacterized protein GLRG_06224 [Colletotrichum graminicola M1.001]EFQ31080.1 hypothetical protein GLRG_06224 [Colletotrichum graminicola M1.001]WDK10695.1 hypothetical protein CGRA01v4_01974 [Colletotrichum graminicola]
MLPSPKRYNRLSRCYSNDLKSTETANGGNFGHRAGCRTPPMAYITLAFLFAATCILFVYVARQTTCGSSFCPSLSSTMVHEPPAPTPIELHCGNTSTEARELGCVFDLLTNNWMPEYCSDPATDDEHRAWVLERRRSLGPWAFFHDDKAQHRVASEEALSDLVGSHIYTTTENHLAHCVFLARRMHRLVTGEIAAVAHNSLAHTMHCTSAILKVIGGIGDEVQPQIGSTFDVGVVSCLINE